MLFRSGALYGSVVKGLLGGFLGGSGLKIFGDLSWPKLVALGGLAASYGVKTIVDDYLAARAARSEGPDAEKSTPIFGLSDSTLSIGSGLEYLTSTG